MYRFILLAVLISAFVRIQAQEIISTYTNPVIRGDFPDPTVIRVGQDYYAAGTTSDFAPNYPLYHSKDLVNWNKIGAVFNNPPEWIKGDCWAPELFYNNGTYYVYYTARKKSDNISCIGVAVTTDISKGFEDKGILIEWGKEAIDAYIFKDDNGELYITWKAYGLDERPIEILASRLSDDGLSLKGEHFTLTDHSKGWKGNGDEGQCIVKLGGYYYLFYSVGGCCDNRCDYRVEVARSRSLNGKWEQYDKNPILQGGEVWRCSGHGTLVQTHDERYFYLYHAYHNNDFEFVGRQGLLDELLWDDTSGWPYFKYGTTPSLQAAAPVKGTVQKRDRLFFDNLISEDNDKYWIWDMNLQKPDITRNNEGMTMAAAASGMCFRGVNPHTGNYTMETSVNSKGSGFRGLSVYGNKENLFMWGTDGSGVKLYSVRNGKKQELYSANLPASALTVYIRVVSVNAKFFRFLWSVDREKWTRYPETEERIDGFFLPQWGKGVRAGIIINSDSNNTPASGQFGYFSMEDKF